MAVQAEPRASHIVSQLEPSIQYPEFAAASPLGADMCIVVGEAIEKQLNRATVPSLGVLAGEMGAQETSVIKKKATKKYPKRKAPRFRNS